MTAATEAHRLTKSNNAHRSGHHTAKPHRSRKAARLQKAGRIALTVLCSLLATLFAAAACMKFAAIDFETHNFAHFGYAPWFMYGIGALELGGAVFLMLDRSRALAALAMAVVMVGAAASHLGAGDGVGMATPAIVVLVLCLVVAYAKRDDLNRVPF